MGTSNAASVTFQLIDIQQFGPQRRFLNRHILMLRSARNLRPKQQAIQTVFELGQLHRVILFFVCFSVGPAGQQI
jgi:hypothetical protein